MTYIAGRIEFVDTGGIDTPDQKHDACGTIIAVRDRRTGLWIARSAFAGWRVKDRHRDHVALHFGAFDTIAEALSFADSIAAQRKGGV